MVVHTALAHAGFQHLRPQQPIERCVFAPCDAVGAQHGAGWRCFIEAFSALAPTGSSGIFGGQFWGAVIGFGVARCVLVTDHRKT